MREEDGDPKNPKAKRIPTRVTKYDRQGRLTEELRFDNYDSPGLLIERQIFHYDLQGRESEIVSVDEREKPPTIARHVYKRNDQGETVEEIQVEGGKEDYRTKYEYDGAGNCVKEISIDDTGAVTATTIRTFDSNHHLLRESTSGAQPGGDHGRTYLYTASGHPSELTSTNSGVLEYRDQWTYNEWGQLTASERLVPKLPADGVNLFGSCDDCGLYPGRATFRYDEAGRLSERSWFQGDTLVRWDHFSYDASGNEVEAWVYEIDLAGTPAPGMTLTVGGKDYPVKWFNGLPSTSYTYDGQGNWIKAVTYGRAGSLESKPQPSEVHYRVIEYY